MKEKIDENGIFGQYILTGSVTDATVDKSLYGEENERHTGTGRIIKKLMRTMSLYETGDSDGSISLFELKKVILNHIFVIRLCMIILIISVVADGLFQLAKKKTLLFNK